MARRGRVVTFHGAFGSRAKAQRKHKRVKGSYVQKRRIRKVGVRWLVLKRRGGRRRRRR